MKKDAFNGKIKHEFVAYMWTSIIVVAVTCLGCGSLFLYIAMMKQSDTVDRIVFLILAVLTYFAGVIVPSLIIFAIRNYPKYPKLRKACLNSDCYFVGSESNEFRGHRRGKAAFAAANYLAEQNKGLENIKYPKKYTLFITLLIVGIAFSFGIIAAVWLFRKNLEALSSEIQGIIFGAFLVTEIACMALNFLLAFRIKKIRETTIKEYRESMRNKKTKN